MTPMWTLEAGLILARQAEGWLSPNYHVALGGGVLHRGTSQHDMDLVVIPHDLTQQGGLPEIRALLKPHLTLMVTYDVLHQRWRARGGTDTKLVEVYATIEGKRVDVIYMGTL